MISEAEYAQDQKIPIICLKLEKWKADGWLGMLIASSTCVDFSSKNNFEQRMNELFTALRKLGNKGDTVDAPTEVKSNRLGPMKPRLLLRFLNKLILYLYVFILFCYCFAYNVCFPQERGLDDLRLAKFLLL